MGAKYKRYNLNSFALKVAMSFNGRTFRVISFGACILETIRSSSVFFLFAIFRNSRGKDLYKHLEKAGALHQ